MTPLRRPLRAGCIRDRVKLRIPHVRLFPDDPPPGPFREGFWRSPIRGAWLASVLSSALLPLITICAVTGFASHISYESELGRNQTFVRDPITRWFDRTLDWPAADWLFAVNQGLHVVCGLLLFPVLLAKLWSVIPKLFEWPPLRSAAHALERARPRAARRRQPLRARHRDHQPAVLVPVELRVRPGALLRRGRLPRRPRDPRRREDRDGAPRAARGAGGARAGQGRPDDLPPRRARRRRRRVVPARAPGPRPVGRRAAAQAVAARAARRGHRPRRPRRERLPGQQDRQPRAGHRGDGRPVVPARRQRPDVLARGPAGDGADDRDAPDRLRRGLDGEADVDRRAR